MQSFTNRLDTRQAATRLDKSAYKQSVIEALKSVARAIVETFPRCEVVIHDFTDLEHSIVWIEGNVTGRQIGGCLTDFGLAKLRAGDTVDEFNYITHTDDGRTLKSSSCFLRYPDGEVFGAVCINVDITQHMAFEQLLREFLQVQSQPAMEETFKDDVEEILDAMIEELACGMGCSVSQMSKEERVQLVKQLDERGAFLLRRAVPLVAAKLGVSRHTIYNYLNELRQTE